MRPSRDLQGVHVRRLAALVLTPLLLACVSASPRIAQAAPTTHPLYSDGGTLRWFTNFREAQTVAAREGRLILVDVCPSGNRACANVIGLIGDRTIRDRVARVAIGHHLDSRSRSPLVSTMRANLPRGSYLPWMGFFTSRAGWVSGFAPSKRTSRTEMRRRFLAALSRAEATRRQILASRKRATSAAAPRVSSTREAPTPRTGSTRSTGNTRSKGNTGSTASATGLHWYRRISEARAAARAQGKMILITSTKPSCSLCKKLRNKIIPQVWGQMSKGCVLYVYDILKPENSAVDRLVRGNLPNARLMPLSGFATADMRWLHGFFGGTDTRQLMGDYRTALRKR